MFGAADGCGLCVQSILLFFFFELHHAPKKGKWRRKRVQEQDWSGWHVAMRQGRPSCHDINYLSWSWNEHFFEKSAATGVEQHHRNDQHHIWMSKRKEKNVLCATLFPSANRQAYCCRSAQQNSEGVDDKKANAAVAHKQQITFLNFNILQARQKALQKNFSSEIEFSPFFKPSKLDVDVWAEGACLLPDGVRRADGRLLYADDTVPPPGVEPTIRWGNMDYSTHSVREYNFMIMVTGQCFTTMILFTAGTVHCRLDGTLFNT